ncbi:MAG: adenylate kinase [Flavobacteriaceae bacterium]|jgi:adenylate kinase
MHAQTLIFFGKSGAGKGTQAKKIVEYLQKHDPKKEVVYFETGKSLRDFNANSDSFAGKLNNQIMQEGKLLPSFMAAYQWSRTFVEKLTGSENEHLIIDGSPRALTESHLIDSALQFFQRKNPILISINISDKSVIERLSQRGRSDDGVNEIKSRLDFYHTTVHPSLNYFENNSDYTILHIDGEQTVEEIHQELLLVLQLEQ